MQSQAMKEFLVLARTLNFQVAADELFISQASLSRHIKELENDLDMILFKRSTRKVELTKLGYYLIPYAERAAALEEEMLANMKAYQSQLERQITIGYISHWDAIDLGKLTLEFQQLHPNALISVVTGKTNELLDLLSEEECSFVIVRSVEPPTEHSDFLCEEPLFAYLPQNHPLASKKQISLEAIQHEPLILGEKGSLSNSLILQACDEKHIQPQIMYQGSGPQQVNYLTQGLGVSISFRSPMMNRVMLHAASRIVQMPIEPKICANIYIAYAPSCMNPVVRELIAYLKNYPIQ